MPRLSFYILPSFRRHSFQRLRSFHLSSAPLHLPPDINQPNPFLKSKALVLIGLFMSLVFVSSVSLAFLGIRIEEPSFRKVLDEVATESPGLVLFGENVDVDIDEPSVTIRWSILACGQNYVLPNSIGAHGSRSCGLPNFPLYIHVDSDIEPTATYDPTKIPFDSLTGERRSIQNLVQFDSDHVLDVHEAQLYPFDTYFLSSGIHAANFQNESVPIQKILTINTVSSFNIKVQDVDSFVKMSARGGKSGSMQLPSRDFYMSIRRPGSARCITLLIFTVCWILTHMTIGHVLLAKRLTGIKPLIKHLISAGVIVAAIPQLRKSMPDAPGLDGVLIDTIGYFPQMVLSSISVIVLLLMLVAREIDAIQGVYKSRETRSTRVPLPRARFALRSRPPATPNANSTSKEIAQYEVHRLVKHLKGEYVFPPVQPLVTEKRAETRHRRRQTVANPEHREGISPV